MSQRKKELIRQLIERDNEYVHVSDDTLDEILEVTNSCDHKVGSLERMDAMETKLKDLEMKLVKLDRRLG